jgi:hypothetical protein
MAAPQTTPQQPASPAGENPAGRELTPAAHPGGLPGTGISISAASAFADAERLSVSQAAVVYAAAGLAVFPCAPGAKRPLTRHGYMDASTDAEQIARWWRRWPTANIGLPTGRPGGFDVLDIDVHPAGSGFPALAHARRAGLIGWTHLVRTPSGGLHLYFPAAVDHGQESWALPHAHVDFRGMGGYVIAPPSQIVTESERPSGYRLIASGRQVDPVDARAVRRLLAPEPRRPPRRPATVDAGRSGERLGAWLAGQPEGNRNRALFWAACRQAEAGVPEDQARGVLAPAAAHTGLGEREIDTTLASAYRMLGHRPASTVSGAYRPGP